MRKSAILWIILLSFLSVHLSAQIHNPVKWTTSHEQTADGEFDLIFTATIDDGWSVYSQYLESDDGPVRTTFEFEKGDYYSLVGKNVETGDKKEGYDELFDMNVIKFFKKVVFTQKIKITDYSKPIVGYLEFMTCDATKCLPPDMVDFEFKLENKLSKGAGAGTGNRNGSGGASKEIVETAPPKAPSKPEPSKTVDQVHTKVTPSAPQNVPTQQPAEPVIAQKPTEKNTSKTESSTAKKDETTPTTIVESTPASIEPNANIESGILDPVKWSLKIDKISDDTYDLTYQAKMDDGWYVYSQYLPSEDGPQKTEFNYDPSDVLTLEGKNEEISDYRKAGHDEFFDMEVIKFKNLVQFKQRISTTDATQPIKGYLLYMTCDDGQCLPPTDVSFYVEPNNLVALVGNAADEKLSNASPTINSNASEFAINSGLANLDMNKPAGKCSSDTETIESDSSYFKIIFLGFIGGLLALLTPCVFPMIPLTVSFFTKGSENKTKGITNAFLYGLFIFLVYLALSVPFHLMDSLNPDILNEISTNVWLNLAFFIIFVFFAFSFFGYYELTLPSSWLNKASGAESLGGVLGVFFMALTLALVSFSCTGPILGSLLAGALTSDGGAWQLTAGMGGFGLALALPFALFALFPRWMNSLPQSGGWLTTVKVVLGFLELALAFKFLSNADLVKHWGILKIEPFLIIEIIIFLGLAIYLFGKIKFPHDSPISKLSPLRMTSGILALAFAIYLGSGFRFNEKTNTFTSLTLLSGLAPPVGYSWIYPKECPNNLDCFKDLDKGLTHAKETGKPIMIDFTGFACVNCRKMEEHVWPLNTVEKYLKEDYVLISLYVDDKKELPEEEQITVNKATGGKRKLRTLGNKWAHLQTELFNNNAQPYYVLLSPDGNLLNKPVGYTPDVNEYVNFLECGLNNYKNIKGEIGMK